jgi:hypothetical protein
MKKTETQTYGVVPRTLQDLHLANAYHVWHSDCSNATQPAAASLRFTPQASIPNVKQLKFESITLTNYFPPYQQKPTLYWTMVGIGSADGITFFDVEYSMDIGAKQYNVDSISDLERDMNNTMTLQNAADPTYTVHWLAPAIKVYFDTRYQRLQFFSSVAQIEFNSMDQASFGGEWFGITANGTGWGTTVTLTAANALDYCPVGETKVDNTPEATHAFLVMANSPHQLGGFKYIILQADVPIESDYDTKNSRYVTNVLARIPVDGSRYGTATTYTKEFFSELFTKTTMANLTMNFLLPDGTSAICDKWDSVLAFSLRVWYDHE